jgi:DNA-binding MarR family transcriptional regulator
MKIEEEIKQAKFKHEYQKLLINQLFTGKWVSDLISKHLKPFQLTSQQYNVLRILRGQQSDSISVNNISDRMIDKMSNVSRLIDKLEQKNLVVRETNLQDRRQMDIAITKKGLELLKEIDEREERMWQHFNKLNEKEAKQLNELLDKLRG